MNVTPYLSFEGRCQEALDFYTKAVGAQVLQLMKASEAPKGNAGECPGMPDHAIMHSALKIGDSMIMATDGRCSGNAKFDGISLSLSVDTPAEAEKRFKALSEGGQVQMPLAPTFFSPSFGMLVDKFGVTWMVLVYKM